MNEIKILEININKLGVLGSKNYQSVGDLNTERPNHLSILEKPINLYTKLSTDKGEKGVKEYSNKAVMKGIGKLKSSIV